MGRDRVAIDFGLHMVRCQHHDEACFMDGRSRVEHAETCLRGGIAAPRAHRQPHPYVQAGVPKIERVCVALASEAENGDRSVD
jgi:hypothetical protein